MIAMRGTDLDEATADELIREIWAKTDRLFSQAVEIPYNVHLDASTRNSVDSGHG